MRYIVPILIFIGLIDEDGRYTVLYSDIYRTNTDENLRYIVPILIFFGLILMRIGGTLSYILIFIGLILIRMGGALSYILIFIGLLLMRMGSCPIF